MKRPKVLRIAGSCLIAVAVFWVAVGLFSEFVGHVEITLSMINVVIVMLNLTLSCLLFMWADLVQRQHSN
jgi:hypothetical protein